ncbi:hypothetical protein ScPMuIL_012973, partial [Solemya velum]
MNLMMEFLVALLLVSLASETMGAVCENMIVRCESWSFAQKNCDEFVIPDGCRIASAVVHDQQSNSPCIPNESYWVYSTYLAVDHGCRADFELILEAGYPMEICECKGDPHCYTLDRKRWHYQGDCEYVMVRDNCGELYDIGGGPKSTFKVLSQFWDRNGASNRVTWVKSATVILGDPATTNITIGQGPTLFVDGIERLTPYPATGQLPYDIYRIGRYIVSLTFAWLFEAGGFIVGSLGLLLKKDDCGSSGDTTTWKQMVVEIKDIDLIVEFDGSRHLRIKLSRQFLDNTCGLCGTLNDNTEDDFTEGPACMNGNLPLPGTITTSPESFGASWATTDDCCDATAAPPCPNPAAAQVICQEIYGEPFPDGFESCMNSMTTDDLAFEMENCVIDICNGATECEIVRSLMMECCGYGFPINSGTLFNSCTEPCGPNQEYSACNSPVFTTCADYLNQVVSEPNEDAAISVGCYCKENFYLDGSGNCVSATDCGCLNGNEYLEEGAERIENPCSTKRVCMYGNMTVVNTNCDVDASCEVVNDAVVCACPANMIDINGDGTNCADPCDVNNCSGHGTCTNCLPECAAPFYTCTCDPCYMGYDCEIEMCAAGTVSTTRNPPCTACPKGTYQDKCAQTHCTDCPPGMTSPPGSDSLDDCYDDYSICQCRGDPHCTSFDKKRFHYQGTCEYLMARDNCDGSGNTNFEIYADFWTRDRPNSKVSWVKSVTTHLHIGGTETVIFFGQGKVVTVDGTVISNFPYPATMSSGYQIVKRRRYVTLKTEMDLRVQWDGTRTMKIKVRDLAYFNNTCGLCGPLNDDILDDFTMGPACDSNEGEITTNQNIFGDSWETSGLEECCGTEDPPDCTEPMPECDEVFDTEGTVFSECLSSWSAEDVVFWKESCIEDICLGGDVICDIITALVEECSDSGFDIDDWGMWNNCKPNCSENMSFLSCEPTYALTCNEYLNEETNDVDDCIADCYCDAGYYYDENTGTCVLPEDCGCQRNMTVGTTEITVTHPDGTVIITVQCSTYIECENNTFVEYYPNCDAEATCEVADNVFSCECPEDMVDINNDGTDCRDPCEGVDCSGQGTCVNCLPGCSYPYYTCTCEQCYTGADCETDPCEGVDCSGHGTCENCWPAGCSSPFYTCNCDPCYTGADCGTEMCTAGTVSTTGIPPCTACPAGTYQDGCGQTDCTDCPPGMTSPPGSDSLNDCYDDYSICQCRGDPHCTSFDKKRFHYQGTCEYLMARDNCDGSGNTNFEIYADFWTRDRPNSRVSWVKSVTTHLHIGGTETVIFFGQGKVVTVDGTVISNFPYPATMSSGYQIVKRRRYVTLKTEMDLRVQWDGTRTMKIKVRDLAYFNNTCGLCGPLNDDILDDFTMGPACDSNEGEITTNQNIFGDSWETSGLEECCGTEDPPDCTEPMPECDEVFDTEGTVFSECLNSWSAEDVAFWKESCIEDICLGGDVICDIITALVEECSDSGFDIDDWGMWNNCKPDCSENMSFLSCEPTYALTCNEYLNEETNDVDDCIADCYCDAGYYYDENTGTCVLPEDCGCQRNMTVGTTEITVTHPDGTVIITVQCSTYIECENNTFVEYYPNCDAETTCEVADNIFSCECPEDMVDINNDGTDCRDPCEGVDCSGQGTCVNCLPGCSYPYYTCTCEQCYTGADCETDPCEGVDCSGHGTCENCWPTGCSSPFYTCNCDPCYTGADCGTDPCEGVDCSGHGTCENCWPAGCSSPFYTCNCDLCYTGADCGIDPCEGVDCSGHGTCENCWPAGCSSPFYTCNCDLCYTGADCGIDPCEGVDCSGHGTCENCWPAGCSSPFYTCNCDPCYTGADCGTEMCAAGSSSTTGNHPGCESCPAGTYQDECGQTSCIVCPNNMTSPAGSDSLTDCYDPCEGVDCSGHGTCENCWPAGCSSPFYTCNCDPCYTGADCGTEMCTAGTVSTTGIPPCTACPAGTYQDGCGQTDCTDCPPGMTSPPGSDSLNDCYDDYSICQCRGDPHCTSFDKKRFHYQGTCEYLMARDNCDGSGNTNFEIYADFWTRDRPNSRVSWVKSVTTHLHIGGTETVIFFGQGKVVTVDGTVISNFPYPATMSSGYQIVKRRRYVTLKTEMDLRVQWDGTRTMKIKVRDLAYFNNTCGLCGPLNDDILDDFTMGPACNSNEGEITTNQNIFGDSWETSGLEECCGTEDPPDCTEPMPECDEVFYTEGTVFGECLSSWSAEDVAFWKESCIEDICLGGDVICDIITALVEECSDSGFDIDDWGMWNNCKPDCSENMSFLSCEPTYALTCNEYLNEETNEVGDCIADCYCDVGYYYDENTGTCVLPEDCGCQRNMTVGTTEITVTHPDGTVIITVQCSTYIECENNTFVEYYPNCDADATCEVADNVFSCECPEDMVDINNDGTDCR